MDHVPFWLLEQCPQSISDNGQSLRHGENMVSCRVAASAVCPAVNGRVLFHSLPLPATVSLFLSALPFTSQLFLPTRKGVRGFWRSQIANLIKPEMSTSHTVLYHQTLPRLSEVGLCLLHANLGYARGLYLCAVTCVSSGFFFLIMTRLWLRLQMSRVLINLL